MVKNLKKFEFINPMLLFVRTEEKCIPLNINEDMTVRILQETVRTTLNHKPYIASHPLDTLVSSVYKNNSILNINPMVLGGEKNINEAGRLIAMEAFNCLICRKCYSKNPLGAKHCRKKGCGRWGDLRPRKQLKKK